MDGRNANGDGGDKVLVKVSAKELLEVAIFDVWEIDELLRSEMKEYFLQLDAVDYYSYVCKKLCIPLQMEKT